MPKITMQLPIQTKTIDKAFDEFLRWCKVKNLSPHTIKFYEVQFNEFLKL